MIDLTSLRGKRFAVMGLGKTGISAAKSLMAAQIDVVAWDDQEAARVRAQEAGIPLLDMYQSDLSGIDVLVWSPGIPHHLPQAHPVALTADRLGIPLVSDVDLLCTAQSSADFIGITGTNGKSTTTALIGHILEQFRPTQVGGNIGTPVLDLSPLGSDGSYVIEMSSYQLELTPHFSPIGAVLLNMTPDHLGRHGGMDGYIAAKKKIFENGHKAKRRPVAVISIDTEPCLHIAHQLTSDDIWTVIPVSTSKVLTRGVYVLDGQLYDVRDSEPIFIADLNTLQALKGRHNHENAACAYAVLHHVYGFDPQHIMAAMMSFGGLQHRQFRVRDINGVVYINDSKATNADATEKALNSYRKIYWICGGQPKEGGLNGLEQYMNRVEHAYLIGEAAPDFAAWMEQNKVPYTHCTTLDSAVQKAHTDAQLHRTDPSFEGAGVVLLSPACASWDQFRSFEHRGDVFAELVMQLGENI